jgi:putative Mg2+ transporter-C (MgtC) family protein
VLRLLVALVLGAVIGLERARRGHAAGIRTMAMVSIGSCLFTLLGAVVVGGSADPTRIAAQVVTGVGFLGAGTILRGDVSAGIRGLTTAATIWVVAAIGMTAGFGYYVLATGSTVLVLAGLIVLHAVREPLLRATGTTDEDEDARPGGT